MATKKNYRANNTYLIEGNTGDNPKLMAQVLSDGRESLYLEFYLGYTRAFPMASPKNPDRATAKQRNVSPRQKDTL